MQARLTGYLPLLIAGMTAASAWGIPADPALKSVRQADGTIINLTMRGDEYGHAIFDEKGNRMEYDRTTGMFIPAAGKALRKGMPRSHDGMKRTKRTQYPTLGKQKSLVVLIEFSDCKFTTMENPHEFYDRMLNEKGFTWSNGANGSARDFYLASSDGKFDPDFVVVGPVTLPKECTYYGADLGTQDARMGEAIKSTLDSIDDEVDFSDYDIDNDGIIDNIFFFYAGYGQADCPGGGDYIWPHSANFPIAWNMNLEYDGKAMGTYACSNEIRYSTVGLVEPTGIGTFVHEFGHVLGLADHYDTGYNQFAFGLASWDTMASGSYNNNMHTPPLFSAFERAEIGWMEYTDLDNDSATLQELPWIGNGEAKGFRVKVAGRDNEWFVLENRQQAGWDEYLPGHGMLIWHVDMDDDRWMSNKVNTDSEHQLLDIVEVDGVGNDATRDSDTMPGTRNITTYSLLSWEGDEVVTFDDVEEAGEGADALIRILTAGSKFSLPAPEVKIEALADESLTFTWLPVEDALYYMVTVKQGDKTVGEFDGSRYPSPEIITISDLIPEMEYSLEVSAGRGTILSESGILRVATEPFAFNKRVVTGVSAVDGGAGSINLTWDAMRDADDYLVMLKEVTRSMEPVDNTYGFDNKGENMPAMWQTSSSSFHSTEGYFGESAPSLRFMKDDDYLLIAYPETLMDGVTFWHADNGSGNMIRVEERSGAGEWTEAGKVTLSATGSTAAITLNGAEEVRLVLEKRGGYAVIDDVTVSGRPLNRVVVPGFDNLSVGNATSATLNGIGHAGMYAVTVTAVNGDLRSVASTEIMVVLDPAGVTDTNMDVALPCGFINMQGIRSLTPWRGMNIVVYTDGSVRKEIID